MTKSWVIEREDRTGLLSVRQLGLAAFRAHRYGMGMNETSATSTSGLSLLPDGIATLTAIHFTIIAVVAILVLIGLIWGIRAKRSRTKATRDVIAHAEEAGVSPQPIVEEGEDRGAQQSQSQTRTVSPAPAPVAPAPNLEPKPVAKPAEPAPEPTAPSPAVAPLAPHVDSGDTPDRLNDEPIAASSPMEASPAAEAKAPVEPSATPSVTAPSYADGPVTQLKGLGPKVAAQLGALGVATVGEMAALSDGEAQRIDAQLGNFTGRMGRDRWIEQARLLAAGDKAGFEAVFGKL